MRRSATVLVGSTGTSFVTGGVIQDRLTFESGKEEGWALRIDSIELKGDDCLFNLTPGNDNNNNNNNK